MISNYLLIALRNLRKHFSYSVINIAGLGLGLATCLLLSIWIKEELSYDSFHSKLDRIYRVSLEYSFGGQTAQVASSPTALLPTLQKNFGDVEQGVRFYNPAAFSPFVVKKDDYLFEESRFYFADSTFFKVFSFELKSGDPENALTQPNTVVITEKTAKKYFGDQDPMGQVLKVNNRADYTVTGVLKDIPGNSMIQFDFVGSFISLDAAKETIWWSANYQTYVVLGEHAALADIQDKTNEIVKEALKGELSGPGDYVKYNFTPMKELYLHSKIEEPELIGSIEYVYIFSAIALLVLLIACINYINLATAKAADRAKEVGVRKVVGAARKQLITQFVGESVVITFISFVVAMGLASFALPFFNDLTGKHFTYSNIIEPGFLSVTIAMLTVIALLSGLYPALIITGFKPVNILKGNFRTSVRGVWLRKSLVVFQFAVSIILIIGTVVIVKQVGFMQSKKLGYDKENVIMLPLDRRTAEVYEQLKTEFLRSGNAVNVGRAAESPVRIMGGYSINIAGGNERGMIVTAMPVDENFIPTMGMEMAVGNNFTEGDMRQLEKDTVYSFILNQSAVSALGLQPESSIGAAVQLNGRKGTIKGIVKDFHFASMHEEIKPLVFFTEYSQLNYFFVRLAPGNPENILQQIKTSYSQLINHRPFEYKFVNDRYAALYQAEVRMGAVCSAFATLAVVIACLGLLGLVAFAAAQKTKEIGIRKVMGATAPGIVLLITKDFARLIVIAILIGIPASWYVMEEYWLTNFVYRTEIGPWPFITAAVGCLLVAFATASYQAVKAALIDPARTLRNE